MADQPPNPDELVPVARPLIPEALPVGQARPINGPESPCPPRHPMYLDDTTRAGAWVDLALFLFGYLAILGLISIVALVVYVSFDNLDERHLQVAALPIQAALLFAFIALLLRLRGQRFVSVGLTTRNWLVDLALGVAAAGAAGVAFLATMLTLFTIWPEFQAMAQGNAESITEMIPRLHPAIMLVVMLIVGFWEELAFRGYLLTRLRRSLGGWVGAVALSSALFAVPHMVQQQMIMVFPLFAAGVVWSAFTILRKSLLPAIIGHALFNSVQFIYLYLRFEGWQ